MQSFKSFIVEETDPSLDGATPTSTNFLQHLSSPSDNSKPSYVQGDLAEGNTHIEIDHRKAVGPMTQHAYDEGNKTLPEGNLHKRIHEGLHAAFAKMASESPEESARQHKISKDILGKFSIRYGLKHPRKSLLGKNMKTEKSSGAGVNTKALFLAPHSSAGLSGFDVCPRASSECRKNCLGTEAGGNRQFPDTALRSKVLTTHFLAQHPEHFARILHHEIGKHVEDSKKIGKLPGVRLNTVSDLAWEHHAPELFHSHPEAQFYDYTKMHNRVGHPNLPKNYHLTLSHTGTGHAETNDKHVIHALEHGHVVAMVHDNGGARKNAYPTHVEDVKTGVRYPIVNGDNDDNTFDRHEAVGRTEGTPGHGVVSGLKLKGVSAASAGHFVNKVDKDGIIRINK